jgi:hypothetical protein
MACTQCGFTRACICPPIQSRRSTLDRLEDEYNDLCRRKQKGESVDAARMEEIELVMNTHHS